MFFLRSEIFIPNFGTDVPKLLNVHPKLSYENICWTLEQYQCDFGTISVKCYNHNYVNISNGDKLACSCAVVIRA